MSVKAVQSRPVVVIPAYKPGSVLVDIAEGLAGSPHVREVVVVDDGSGPDYAPIFYSLAREGRARILSRKVNRGKGEALKQGFETALCRFPDSSGVVTADADGQHLVMDILRVAEALENDNSSLILGARSFDRRAPFRNRIGNLVTRRVMSILTGCDVGTTQTGLRGIPMPLVPRLVKLTSSGYEFETEMLLYCMMANVGITELKIETIYFARKGCSHFRPFADSLRVYSAMLRFWSSSRSR